MKMQERDAAEPVERLVNEVGDERREDRHRDGERPRRRAAAGDPSDEGGAGDKLDSGLDDLDAGPRAGAKPGAWTASVTWRQTDGKVLFGLEYL